MSFPSRSLITVALLTASVVFAWTQDGEAAASFDAKGPAGFKIRGEAKKVTVTDDGKNLKIAFKLEDLDTDNSLRNRHMLEDTQAKDFPEVSLTVPLSSLKESGDNVQGMGTFEIHGKKKETPFTYNVKCTSGACDVDGSSNINLTDFGIKIRSYLGITVKPEITVGAKFRVKK